MYPQSEAADAASLCAFSDVWLSHAAAGMRLNQEFVSLSSTAREENPYSDWRDISCDVRVYFKAVLHARLHNGRPLFGRWLNYANDHFITVVMRNCFRMSYTLLVLLVLLMTFVFGRADLTVRMLIMSINMKTYWHLLYLQNEYKSERKLSSPFTVFWLFWAWHFPLINKSSR